jgi:hypothetical protein
VAGDGYSARHVIGWRGAGVLPPARVIVMECSMVSWRSPGPGGGVGAGGRETRRPVAVCAGTVLCQALPSAWCRSIAIAGQPLQNAH